MEVSDEGVGIGQVGAQIERLTQAAQSVQVLKIGGHSSIVYLGKPGGQHEKLDLGPGFSNHQVADPDELKRWISDGRAGDEVVKNGVVFVSKRRCVYLADATDGRNRAFCEMELSDQFSWLEQNKGKPLSQRDFVKVLRLVFRDSIPGNSDLAKRVGKVKFVTNKSNEREIEHGKDSWGAAVNSQVVTDLPPDEVTIAIDVFRNHPSKTQIRVAIEIDPADEKFYMIPLPDQMRNAEKWALGQVVEAIQGAPNLGVYLGEPAFT